ncbi:MAG: M24 family metallopeptidase [Candidatus Caldarchaeum sp.]
MIKIKAAALAAQEILNALCRHVQAGVGPEEIERMASRMLLHIGARPTFPDYGFPYTMSIGRKNIIAHGVPTGEPFEPGEIVRLDIGFELGGACADLATTVMIGSDPEPMKRLYVDAMLVARRAAHEAAAQAWAGNTVGALWDSMCRIIHGFDYAILENLVGHGIGRKMHEEPLIQSNSPVRLRSGQVLCIEPFVILCDPPCRSVEAQESSGGLIVPNMVLGVHYEVMVLVQQSGGVILAEPMWND